MHINIAVISALVVSTAALTCPRQSTTTITSTVSKFGGRCSPITITKRISSKCPGPVTKTVTKTTTVTQIVDPGAEQEEIDDATYIPPSTTTKGPQTPELPKCPPSKTVSAFRTCLSDAAPCPSESRCSSMNFNLTYDCACIGAEKQVTTTVFNTRCKGDCGCTPTITWTAKGPCVTPKNGEKPNEGSGGPGGKGDEKEDGETKEEVVQEEQEEIDDAMGGY
ncbi:hypothetical protein TWF481_003623 [Arthrobotrys musiformis]|uniref:Uncharacterized protein n=1 Tax=Arthrobotrys musiformis TaxID=47236 RepID=A0AAV9WH49_9PEZI